MRITFVSPYACRSISEIDRLRVIDYFNRLDQKQCLTRTGRWMHQIEWSGIQFGAISLAGLRIASRLLHVTVQKPDIHWMSEVCCATAKASFNLNTLAGAYSLPASADYAELVAGTMAQRNAIRKVVPEHMLVQFVIAKKVYFAHPLTMFGSQQAREALASIKLKAPDWVCIDPEVAVISTGRQAMTDCLQIVQNCNALVFISNGQRNISKGVYAEVDCALRARAPVFWLNDTGQFQPVKTLARFKCHKLDFNHYASLQ